jgi:uncharacterized protein YodC (DUF2158 family)
MTYEAGSIVMLKSGGQPMTVVSASDDEIECVWLGEEGEFFRQTIPSIALQVAPGDDEDEEEEDEDESGEDEVAEDDEEASKPKAERAA